MIKQYLLYDICSESHPSKSLKNLRHTVRIHMQPKQVVQRDSNNESKSRKSIPTSNLLYIENLIQFNSVIYIDKTHIAAIS